MRYAVWSLIALLVCADRPVAQSPAAWLYVSAFRGGSLAVFDLASLKFIHAIPVDDAEGSIGAAITSDGRRLLVVDGDRSSKLRVLDSASGREIASHPFENRVLLLGGGPVVHLTADDNWLLIDTYDYPSAAAGVRVFDVRRERFASLGLRSRACGAPAFASARDGTLFAVCPHLAQELAPLAPAPGEFIERAQAPTAVADAADVLASSDGSRLYILEKTGSPWRLVEWTRKETAVRERDLRQALDLPPDAAGRGGHAWMDVSPDGKTLGLVTGRSAWILEAQTLRVLHKVDLPSPSEGARFSPDGQELLTLRRDAGRGGSAGTLLVRIHAASGEVREAPLSGVTAGSGLAVFTVAPAPR
jgi:hypothetical protein